MFPDYQRGFTGGPGYDASPHAIPLASGKGFLNFDVHGNHLGIWYMQPLIQRACGGPRLCGSDRLPGDDNARSLWIRL